MFDSNWILINQEKLKYNMMKLKYNTICVLAHATSNITAHILKIHVTNIFIQCL